AQKDTRGRATCRFQDKTTSSAQAVRQASATPSTLAALEIRADGDRLAFEGELCLRTLADAERSMRGAKVRSIDVGNLNALDTSGALFLCNWRRTGGELSSLQP